MNVTKNIIVGEQIFPCPVNWTVDQARNEIRSAFVLSGGYIAENNIPLAGTDTIREKTGDLEFVAGKPIQLGILY